VPRGRGGLARVPGRAPAARRGVSGREAEPASAGAWL
jgi:hypothetical protein